MQNQIDRSVKVSNALEAQQVMLTTEQTSGTGTGPNTNQHNSIAVAEEETSSSGHK